jgi:RNA polymerase sigma factor (TIGR02999 family)
MEPTIPRLFDAAAGGDAAALDAIVALLYDELRALAHQQRRRWQRNDTIGTTALVNELYLKLHRQQRIGTASREHFLALASRAMRHILSTYATQQRTQKRGGGWVQVTLDDAHAPDSAGAASEEDVLAVFDSLLAHMEASSYVRQCRVVECRFYGGLSVEETAAALRVSPRTVKRDWAFAQAWLKRAFEERHDDGA